MRNVRRALSGAPVWRLVLSAVIVTAALLAVAMLSPSDSAGPCKIAQDPAMMRDVPEASGLAVSRRHPNLLWTHNDSGNESDLFALDASGTVRGRVRLPLRTRDWEDLSAAPCGPGASAACLFIGDIGNNATDRTTVQVYRVPEPEPGDRRTAPPVRFNVTYPDGFHNAEAMFIADGRLFIVTKDRVGALYGSTAALDNAESGFSRITVNITLQRLGQLELVGVSDAEAAPDGKSVAVRTADEVVIYRSADLVQAIQPGGVQPVERIPVKALREPQGEGVALGENGMIYLASEGQPWSRAGRFLSLRCPAPT